MNTYLDPVCRSVTLLFLITTMMSIGLQVTASDLRLALADRHLVVRALLVNFLLVPLLGLFLVRITGIDGPPAIALLLLAACAGGPNALQFTSKVKGSLAFAATLLFVLSLLSVFLGPAIGGLLLRADAPLELPVGGAAVALLLWLLLPLLAGLAVHRLWPRGAAATAKPLMIIGTVAFVLVVLHTMALKKAARGTLDRLDLLALVALILGSMILGWLAGGPARETRRVLASTTGMRNAAVALLIALQSYPGTGVDVAVIAGVALMIPANMLYTLAATIRGAVAARGRVRRGRGAG